MRDIPQLYRALAGEGINTSPRGVGLKRATFCGCPLWELNCQLKRLITESVHKITRMKEVNLDINYKKHKHNISTIVDEIYKKMMTASQS